jgi:CRP-like cAMP-binding protein
LARDSLLKMAVRRRSKEAAMMVKRRLPSANRPPPVGNPNRLLAALPAADYTRILPSLTVVPLKLKNILHKPGEPIREVYFPGGGFCSMLTVLEDGGMVEIATIGREGMVGVSAVLDGAPVTSAAMVQGETDTCYRMKVDLFRREIDRHGAFHDLMAHYAQALFGFVAQSTACNAVHSVEQRLARWLLMARDRMGRNDFPLTQEFASMMLGASRPTVTIVAGMLQKAGLITYHRGQIKIIDGDKLEAASCECYRAATNLLKSVTDGSRTR